MQCAPPYPPVRSEVNGVGDNKVIASRIIFADAKRLLSSYFLRICLLCTVTNHLTLSTTEVGRFLHTVPSTLGGTSVSAFTSSRLMDYLQGLCHQPVNGLHKRHYLLSKPYIHVYVPSARTTPHLSRPGALFRLSDIQATSKELMED